MKLAVVADNHQGARGGSKMFRDYMRYYWENEFFPELKRRGIDTIIHAGDFFDNRNSLTLNDIDFVENFFIPQLEKNNIEMWIVAGNHDIAYKNTNAVTSLSMFRQSDNVHVIQDETWDVNLGGQSFLFVPWLNPNNAETHLQDVKNMSDKEKKIVVGHFEIEGAKMYKNSKTCEHGLDQKIFQDYKGVWSGHFHHPSQYGCVRYLGSMFYINWADYGDDRGWYVYDTETEELEFVANEICPFTHIDYKDDILDELDEVERQTLFKDQIIVVTIDQDYDRVKLMDFISKIESYGPVSLDIENNYAVKSGNTNHIAQAQNVEGKSVIAYIDEYVDSVCQDRADEVKSKFNAVHDNAAKRMVEG